jgi:hypothetical protein
MILNQCDNHHSTESTHQVRRFDRSPVNCGDEAENNKYTIYPNTPTILRRPKLNTDAPQISIKNCKSCADHKPKWDIQKKLAKKRINFLTCVELTPALTK